MRFIAMAVDYDGTLATEGRVEPRTLAAIERFLDSGRKLIVVTGRILDELLTVFSQSSLCASIVAENGAVLYQPSTRERTLLGFPAPPALIDALTRKRVMPLSVGESIVATVRPHGQAALEAIRDLGLEHHVIFNRESVMVLSSGVNKGTGLGAALKELRLSPHNVVTVGDSENDHALLQSGQCAVAVTNAVPMLKSVADRITLGGAIVFGNAQRGPTVAEIVTALENPDAQIVVNLIGLPLSDRPSFFLELWPHLEEWRSKTGRPHRILVDEAHHLLPSGWRPLSSVAAQHMTGMMFVTVHPEQASPSVLQNIDIAVALGDAPDRTLQSYADQVGLMIPRTKRTGLDAGEAMMWRRNGHDRLRTFYVASCRGERRRHRRKYAEGELPPDRSFYFRGAERHLNLRAQNLTLFRQLAEGVDDATWMHHLREGDYSRWIEEAIKDRPLAQAVHEIEQDASTSAEDSRWRVAHAIEERYTLPAGAN